MEFYTVALIRVIEAERPDDAAQEFIDEAGIFSWIVQVDKPNGTREYLDVMPNRMLDEDKPSFISASRLRICPACGGKVETDV
jgi:hypothetical protein